MATDSLNRSVTEAAITLASTCVTSPAARLVQIVPTVVLYMLNAAVVICVAIRTGGPQQCGADLGQLLQSIVSTWATHGRSSLNPAIATNTQEAINALFRLVRRLAQSHGQEQSADGSGASAGGAGQLELGACLRNLAELSTSPDAEHVLRSTTDIAPNSLFDTHQESSLSLQQPQEHQQSFYTPDFQSLALLDGLDFVKWTESLLENWETRM